MNAVVETRGLCKQYGPALRVNHLDLTVPEGAVYGFLGPNGEHHVQQRRVGLRLCPRPAGLGAVGCQGDGIARPLQQLSHHAPQLRRVVHQ